MRFEEALVEARKGKMIKRRGAGHIYRTFSEGEFCELYRSSDGTCKCYGGYPISLQAISADDWFAVDYNEDLIQ